VQLLKGKKMWSNLESNNKTWAMVTLLFESIINLLDGE